MVYAKIQFLIEYISFLSQRISLQIHLHPFISKGLLIWSCIVQFRNTYSEQKERDGYFHNGSSCHKSGKPIARVSTTGYRATNDFSPDLNRLPGSIISNK